MIKIEHTNVYGFEAAIRGMRNPWNSWEKSDSYPTYIEDEHTLQRAPFEFFVGENDLALMKKLVNAGTDHSKFMRMINVTCDITAPLYWVAEHDTYKVGTVRNSCSFMHKGISKQFEINDFSIQDKRISYLLNPVEKEKVVLSYPYETSEYKIYELNNGRKYKVFRNGRIFACEFECADVTGRKRTFEEKEVTPSRTRNGYFEMNLGGRTGEKWLLHRLVAMVWLDNKNNFETINHIDGNKGNNCVENLEWCSRSENIQKAYETGLYDKNQLHGAYHSWKSGHVLVEPYVKQQIKVANESGMTRLDIAQSYNLGLKQVDNLLYQKPCENEELFLLAYYWEETIDFLNALRSEYLETQNDEIFKMIRQLLPQGYNTRYTWQANYAVLRNMYHARKNHKLDEWHDFCHWIESLPYSELITGGNGDEM